MPRRPTTAEPIIIPPGEPLPRDRASRSLDDETLSRLATLLDDIFRIPGTSFRFGLDSIIGLIPGAGDLVSSLASFVIIYSAWQRKLPRSTVARMVANVAIDTLVGSMPIVGDAFDVVWKSNRKNVQLLQLHSAHETPVQRWNDRLFLVGVCVILLVLAAVPFAVLYLIIHLLHK